MIDRSHGLSLSRQAEVLKLSRAGVYYKPGPVSAEALAIMRRIDEFHLDYPFAGSRMLRDLLRAEGVGIGRQWVATLMKRIGIEAIYRRPSWRAARSRCARSTVGRAFTISLPSKTLNLPLERTIYRWEMTVTGNFHQLRDATPGSALPARAAIGYGQK